MHIRLAQKNRWEGEFFSEDERFITFWVDGGEESSLLEVRESDDFLRLWLRKDKDFILFFIWEASISSLS